MRLVLNAFNFSLTFELEMNEESSMAPQHIYQLFANREFGNTRHC